MIEVEHQQRGRLAGKRALPQGFFGLQGEMVAVADAGLGVGLGQSAQ
jgi:hypothetical protein